MTWVRHACVPPGAALERVPIRDVSYGLLLQTRTALPKQHCSQAGSIQMFRIGHLSHSAGVFVLRPLIARYLPGADG